MKQRIKHTIYLLPAIFLLLIWVAISPRLTSILSTWELIGAAIVSAMLATWCITIFGHALHHDKS